MKAKEKDSMFLFYLISTLLLVIILVFGYFIWRESSGRIGNPTGKATKTPKEKQKEVLSMIGKRDPKNLSKILQSAKSRNSRERLYSLRALQYYGVSKADHILPFLRDSENNIRNAAVQILGNMGYLPAVSPILRNLRREKKMASQILEIQALGKICRGKAALSLPVFEYFLKVFKAKKHRALSRYIYQALISITAYDPKVNNPERYWIEWLERKVKRRRGR